MWFYTVLSWDSNDNINHLSFRSMAYDFSRIPQRNSSLIIQNCPLYKMCLDKRIRKQDNISFCYLSYEYEIHYSTTVSLFFQYLILRTRKTYGFLLLSYRPILFWRYMAMWKTSIYFWNSKINTALML